MIGYYKNFIKDYGKIAKALINLLKNGTFKWNEKAQRAFEQLRILITQVPMLALPDFNKSFTIECDALRKGIRVVLL